MQLAADGGAGVLAMTEAEKQRLHELLDDSGAGDGEVAVEPARAAEPGFALSDMHQSELASIDARLRQFALDEQPDHRAHRISAAV